MPKYIPYEKISDFHYEFHQKVKVVGNDARIQVPKKLGDQIKGKKVKVTIEVIDDH